MPVVPGRPRSSAERHFHKNTAHTIVNISRSNLSFVLAGVLVFGSACSVIAPPKDEKPAPVEEPVAEEPTEPEPQEPAPKHTDAEYEQLAAAYRELEDRAIKTQLLLLEREIQIQDLNQRLQSQQRRIDETISEVVRAKAKLMSVESRAEAASQMAEAEIALAGLGDVAGGAETASYVDAADMIASGTKEFESENYGGAMFLASQAKTVISLEQLRLQDRVEIETSAGERAFEAPLPLQVIANSNVRDGPGLNFNVVATIDKGTAVTGYSYKGKWVQVSLGDGTRGWVYQTLVGGRR